MTERQQAYLKNRAKGKNKKESALAAGYALTTANRAHMIESPDVKRAFAEMIRKYVPGEKIAKRVAEGLDAHKTEFFSANGIVMDQRECVDFGMRATYAKLAAEYGGYFTPQVDVVGVIAHVLTPGERKEAEDSVKRLAAYDTIDVEKE